MAASTTIRVDLATHKYLIELSEESGDSLIDTVRQAAEALRRQRFAHRVRAELAELQRDPKKWAAYLAEAEVASVADGLS